MRIPQEDIAYSFKIVIVGAGGVGKTCLFNRYCFNFYNNDSELTIGINFHSMYLHILCDNEVKYIINSIFDFGGQDRFKPLFPKFIEGADGALLVFDSVSYTSFEKLDYWNKKLTENGDIPIPKILVGSKSDLIEKTPKSEIVNDEVINNFLMKNKIELFMRISALQNLNILEVFRELTLLMLKQNKIRTLQI